MELVPLCIRVSLFAYPAFPVKPVMNDTGIADTVAEVVAYMIGLLATMLLSTSMLTNTLKMGFVPIHTLMVTVSSDPEGIVLNPDI